MISNFVTLLIEIIISAICDLSHGISQDTSAKKMHTDVTVSRRDQCTSVN